MPAPAPAPAAPNSPYPGAAPAGGSVPPVYGSVSAPVYPGGGAVPPQTPYNPYMQGGQPNGQPGWSGSYGSVPPEANQKYNGLAIAGFICSFLVSLLGLILSIVGLNQIKKQGGKGKGLAIAGIIISAAGMVIQVILVIALIVGTIANYVVGTAMFCVLMNSSIAAGVTACVLPFIPTAVIKAVLATVIGFLVRKRIPGLKA